MIPSFPLPSYSPSYVPSKSPIEPCVDDPKYKSKLNIGSKVIRKTCAKMKLKKKKNRNTYCELVDNKTKEKVKDSCKKGCLVCV